SYAMLSLSSLLSFRLHATPTTQTYPLSLHDALPIFAQRPLGGHARPNAFQDAVDIVHAVGSNDVFDIGESPGISVVRRVPIEARSEEHTSELQSHLNIVCRLLLENNKKFLRSTIKYI